MSASLPTLTSSWMHLQTIVGHTQKSLLFSHPISIRVHPKSLTGMLYAHFLHGHPHPVSRTLSMSPPGMGLLHTPRSLFIQDYQSEPYHQHQNMAENHFGLAKHYTNTVMNTSGCPACCWLLCLQYICVVLNHLAFPTLQGICPVQALQGTTPDVSFLLHFSFYEPVYYRIDSSEPDLNFPSSSNEKKGYWVDFADNQGDRLTWRILTEDTQKIIICSGVRSANQHLASPSGEGTTLPFPFLILNNLQILCHLTPLMHQHPILSTLSTVSVVRMKIIQSTWPTLISPIILADFFFYQLRIMGSATWPKSLTLMTMDNLLKTLNSS